MNILYIHGLGGSGHGKISESLKSFGTVIAPSLKFAPKDNIEYLLGMVRTGTVDLIVGNSLGGLYARYLHAVTGIDTVCINPVSHRQCFDQSLGENTYFDTGEKFTIDMIDVLDIGDIINLSRMSETEFSHPETLQVFLSECDDVVDPEIIKKDKYICNKYIIPGAGHRLLQEQIDEIFRIFFSTERIV